MADPLSITASVIAIIGFANECSQGIAKLRSLQHASTELSALLNEVSDLKTVLTQVIALTQQLQGTQSGPADGALLALKSLLKRAEDQLLELHDLVQKDLRKTKLKQGQVKADKVGWIFNKDRAASMQQSLRATRLNLVTALGVVNSCTLNRVELAIQSISTAQAADSDTLQQVLSLVSNLPLGQPTAQPAPGSAPPLFPNSSISRLWDNNVSSQQSWTAQQNSAKAANSFINIKARVQTYKLKCKTWCSCPCHKTKTIRYPEWLKAAVGGLFVGYTGLPVFSSSCTEAACRQRSAPSIEVTYHFPSWFLSRVLSFSLRISSLAGPELNLRMPRMVNWTTPLWQKSAVGDVTAIQTLFSHGQASPYDVNAYGQSALHYAADIGAVGLCQLLIQNNADVYLRDENGRRPIDYAWDSVLSKRLDTKVSLQLREVFSQDDFLETRQFTVLHKVVLDLIPSSISTQLALSTADINMVDDSGRTCLSWAAARGDTEALKTLLEYGADPRIVDMERSPPLFHAVRANCLQCVSLLIDAGSNLSTKDVFGGTALHVACTGADAPEMIKLLVQQKEIDINAIDYDGDTALKYAARAKLDASAQYLLEAGADPMIANVAGDTTMHMAIEWGALGVVEKLVKHGLRFSGISSRGQTILHVLACHYDEEIIRVLCGEAWTRNIDTTIRDEDGLTCFDYLQRTGDEAISNERVRALTAFLRGDAHHSGESEDESFEDALEELSL